MNLKIELFRYGTLVFGKVLEQAEKLRGNEPNPITLAETDGFKIKSFCWPDLIEGILSVRGDRRKCDDEIFFFRFSNEKKAIETCKFIRDLVAEINSDTDADLGGIVRVM